jgi:hypothetical protein
LFSRGALFGVLAFALTFVVALAPAGAVPLSQISTFGGPGSGAGQLSEPERIAVDQATGDVYVADRGNNRVDKFDASGNFILTFGRAVDQTTGGDVCTAASGDTCQAGTFGGGAGQLKAPEFVAVDNSGGASAGDVYVGDLGGTFIESPAARVSKFDSSGAWLSTNEGRSAPRGRIGGGEDLSGLTVDPGGNLWAYAASEVYEFSAAGTYMQSWFDHFGAGSQVTDISVDANHVFVINPASRVVRLGRGGSLEGYITPAYVPPPTKPTKRLAIDQSTGDIYTDNGAVIEHYDSACSPIPNETPGGGGEMRTGCPSVDSFAMAFSPPGGLGLDSSTTTLYVADDSGDQIVVFGPPSAGQPAIDSERLSSISSSNATVNATVTPMGLNTGCEVQYVDDASFQSSGYAGASSLSCSPGMLGGGYADEPASATIAGLNPGATYHFRFVAASSAGTADGEDRTITTDLLATGLPDGRAYELVSPPAKDSTEPFNVNAIFASQAAVSGNGLASGSLQALPGSQFDGVDYLSTRGDGWSTQNLLPPQSTEGGGLCATYSAINAYSSDLSKGVLNDGLLSQYLCGSDSPPLVAGEPQRVENLFLRDNTNGTYQLVSLNPVTGPPADATFEGSSPDLSHVVFEEAAQLTGDAPGGAENLYDWSGGRVALVGVLPGGATVSGATLAGGGTTGGDRATNFQHAVSTDGSRIFFQAAGGLYGRLDGTRTVQIDASHAAGPGGGGQFQIASADGSVVFFTDDASAGLTADTVPGSGQNLYRYDVDSGQLLDLTPGAEASVDGVSGAGEDGGYVYFVADAKFAAGATSGQPNLYVSHAGSASFIATLDAHDDHCDWQSLCMTARISTDGTHIAFNSDRRLVSFDTAGSPQVYLYNASIGGLICASCSPGGKSATGAATINPPREMNFFLEGGAPELSRNLSSDGTRLFFETTQASVSADGNEVQDVYEYEADGAGSCHGQRGCLYLISGGASGGDKAYFIDASANGDDVFIGTSQRLLPQDTDEANDIYDARVGGGLPSPGATPACNGESCKPPATPAPASSLAASAMFLGAGNLAPSVVPPAPRAKPVTNAQKLANALKLCGRKPRRQRRVCRVRARKRYGAHAGAVRANRQSSILGGGK